MSAQDRDDDSDYAPPATGAASRRRLLAPRNTGVLHSSAPGPAAPPVAAPVAPAGAPDQPEPAAPSASRRA